MRATVMEVNIDKFKRNINVIKEYAGKELMPIVKANAYGTYLNKNIELMNEFKILGVALVDEAVSLRKNGYKNEILVINQPYIDEIDDIIKYDITIGLSSIDFLRRVKSKIKVHLEIETGMNRTGIKLNELDNFIKELKKQKNIIVEGIYTHLSSADYDIEYTKMQYDLFEKAVQKIKGEFKTIKYIHSDASNGLLNYNNDIANLIRVGIIQYGYYSFKEAAKIIKLEPIATLKTKITFIKAVKKGESISYSRKYKADKDMIVATIPIGYADGFRRSLTGNFVVVNGKKAKIVGTICMDSCMIDVTTIDVKVGDVVYIWDNKIITLEDISEKCGTINYEIISAITDRVPRVFT